MTAQVYIVLAQAKDALLVPATAVDNIEPDGSATVRVVDASGNVVDKKVKVGINNNVNVQILSGLAEGDSVIVSEGGAPGSSPARMRMRM